MYNFMQVVLAVGCIVAMAQSGAVGGDTDTPIQFKENQILRDADDAAIDMDDSDDVSAGDTTDHNVEDNDHLSLDDQVRLLTKQMTVLMTRRREDFKLLENNLKKSMRKNAVRFADADVRSELDKLR